MPWVQTDQTAAVYASRLPEADPETAAAPFLLKSR